MPATKDILIVVHGQFEAVYRCLESVVTNADGHTAIWVWDNASDQQTATWLAGLGRKSINLIRCTFNAGFTQPANALAGLGISDYIICLNSDTIVQDGWDQAMIDELEKDPDLGLVGYGGGHLDEDFLGHFNKYGRDIDYVEGWCFCMRRADFCRYGMFARDLRFAYAEDSDLSIRLKSHGMGLLALDTKLVIHAREGGMGLTAKAVADSGLDLGQFHRGNLNVLKKRWGEWLHEHGQRFKKP